MLQGAEVLCMISFSTKVALLCDAKRHIVFRGLLTCLRHFTDHVTTKENQEPIQKCFESMEHIIKMIVKSRLLFLHSSMCQKDRSFTDNVKLLFNSFNKMLSHTNDSLEQTQIVFLSHVSSLFPHLLRILSVVDVAEFATLM